MNSFLKMYKYEIFSNTDEMFKIQVVLVNPINHTETVMFSIYVDGDHAKLIDESCWSNDNAHMMSLSLDNPYVTRVV